VVGALEIAAGVAVLAGAALQSATGFGFALVSAPLVFAAAEPEQAVWLLVLLGLVVNLMTLGTEGRRPQPLVRDSLVILAWAIPGVGLGVVALHALGATALQIGVTLGVFATLAVRAATRRRSDSGAGGAPRWAAPAAGFASGALTTSTNTAGPPVVLYALARGATPVQTRDTLTATFIGLAALGGAALAIGGAEAPHASALAALIPCAVVGHLLGRPVFARIAEDRYEPVLTGVLIVTALAGLATALL
jgi:uncharacterized membrane protein YfcA